MNTPQLREKLLQLTTPQIKRLAHLADVSERALWKIRSGETKTASESVRDAVRPKFSKAKSLAAKEIA